MQIVVNSSKIKNGVEWIGKNINSPEQRLLCGATALMTQPVIDYKNKNINEDTRMISVARTLAKITAGTLVGVAVRYGAIALVKKFAQYEAIAGTNGLIETVKRKDNRQIFAPVFKKMNNIIGKLTKAELENKINKHIKAMGTIVATFAALFTNFAIDAPITRFLTKKFHGYIVDKPKVGKQEDKS